MSRLRMASGMAAAGIGAARGPASALLRCGGRVWAVLIVAIVAGVRATARGLWATAKAAGRASAVILPWLAATAATAILAYFGCRLMFRIQADVRTAAEATKHETAFGKSAEAAVDSANDLDINARVRALVTSRLAVHGSDNGPGFSSLDGVPDEPADYKVLIALITPNPDIVRAHGVQYDRDHTVKLMVIQMDWGREYISVEVNGQQAYLCIVNDQMLWVYKGIGLWEHLLDETEAFVDRDRQRQEIDSRFGNLEVGKK